MLDAKYGLKYSMPHSIVHIVDNSIRPGTTQPTVVDDPSLYSTIVVTGAPMGVDNEIISINRSDVLNVSCGLDNITASDIEKYGQSVTYPQSLLDQGVPIKFLRVTPENSTYAFSCLLIQWRYDATDGKVHVRFKTTSDAYSDGLPAGYDLSSFKNPQRLNAALVRGFKKDNEPDADGSVWKQRVFMTAIAAGRGKTYNYYNYAINSTQQSKRPSNVKYLFSTIDTRSSNVVEQFHASLINQTLAGRVDPIDTVNVQVNQRVKGSSVIIPTINEAAITELYNEYMRYLDSYIASNVDDSDDTRFIKNVYKTMSINIFDPIYGRYIYNGDTDVLLPMFQVDMLDLDIAQLDKEYRINVTIAPNSDTKSYVENPTALYDKLNASSIGITNPDNTYHIGDIFVLDAVSPKLTIITTINQYTGSVTSIPITSVNVTDGDSTVATPFAGTLTYTSKGETIDAGSIAKRVDDLIKNNKISPKKSKTYTEESPVYINDAFIVINSTNNAATFQVAIVAYKVADGKIVCDTAEGKTRVLSNEETYKVLTYPTTTVTAFATKAEDPSWKTPGSTVIKDGVVYVNNYDHTENHESRLKVQSKNPFVVGICPTAIAVTKTVVGNSYDVIMYSDKSCTYKVTAAAVVSGGSDYTVGQTFKATGLDSTTFKVESFAKNSEGHEQTGVVGTISVVSSNETSYIIDTETHETTVGAEEAGTGLTIKVTAFDAIPKDGATPNMIKRYVVSGTSGSIYRVGADDATNIPANYYTDNYGLNPNSETGGIPIEHGYAGFFDDDISEIEFKYRYSDLLVKAFRGEKDPRILSPVRVPAKYLFDGGFNTIVGQTILPYITYQPIDVINASTIFTADEKEAILLDNSLIANLTEYADIDVKQAMYDLMEQRCYQRIPEDKRPIGPGSGLSLHLDSGVTDATTALAINQSFIKRFSNPNASWDIGGYVSSTDGVSYTYTKRIVDNLFAHMKQYNVNKPFIGKYSNITPDEYISFFPDIDATDWEMRELLYNSGGNAWVMDINGNLQRKSQRTLYREGDTSDLIQESNMRTLSQLVYLLQNKIDSYLFKYDDDGVLKTLKDDCDNMFTNWVGNYVQALDISFQKDINPDDGGEIVVCYCNVTFRCLILIVPIIVNVQRRAISGS